MAPCLCSCFSCPGPAWMRRMSALGGQWVGPSMTSPVWGVDSRMLVLDVHTAHSGKDEVIGTRCQEINIDEDIWHWDVSAFWRSSEQLQCEEAEFLGGSQGLIWLGYPWGRTSLLCLLASRLDERERGTGMFRLVDRCKRTLATSWEHIW